MAVTPQISAVVPTLGRSPLLAECLEALRADGGAALEIVLVLPAGFELPAAIAGLMDRRVRLPEPAGFATATNAGIAAATAPFLATVNDDAVIQPGWCATLHAELEKDPALGAVQGVNLRYDTPAVIDGAGLEWNSWWQAIQLGHGEPFDESTAPRKVFGVSATAALYRREALDAAAHRHGKFFDERLGSYYEDAELAVRLRRAGWRARSVPAARALHAGSTTSGAMSVRRWRWIHGNRWLAAAALLGEDFRGELPRLLTRDLRDLVRAAATLNARRIAGILLGWGRAGKRLRGFRHGNPPLGT
ncbi:MAG: glycosyltransferase family 2 protein [Acidobacteriota bacterium]